MLILLPGVNDVCRPVKSTASDPLVTERFAGSTLLIKFDAEIVLFGEIVILAPGVRVSWKLFWTYVLWA